MDVTPENGCRYAPRQTSEKIAEERVLHVDDEASDSRDATVLKLAYVCEKSSRFTQERHCQGRNGLGSSSLWLGRQIGILPLVENLSHRNSSRQPD